MEVKLDRQPVQISNFETRELSARPGPISFAKKHRRKIHYKNKGNQI